MTDLRAGTTFLLDGQPWLVLKYEHIKMGRGGATIKVKTRNLVTGSVVDKKFSSGSTVEPVLTSKRKLQFLYSDANNAVFMDTGTYEQVEMQRTALGPQLDFLKEGVEVDVLFCSFDGAQDKGDRPLLIELPAKVVLTVSEAEPGVKGDSASNMYKQAVLENGFKIKVPLFVNKGNKVAVDTRTGEYVERVKQ